ncbi:uncharacterized integral membrane protein, putative [Candida dubliniensis CD36]|uniref:Uncharacterized integral membrane protein, putative n=1 Tax=Candida dubliniensis (strain CD36 / ATCC MYA-646 / CBS 7987 / NCPF 3949 / NRRL Y-17841) TaxID=573826 RepID=B9WGW0_CANDC|nr:uncharacterized integral membrane protein, putative [Candida dubliniensis CD36]CAX41398.1 uncharacterized integral membrane protein, putative [Candida dubliniensis CD36]
MSRRVVGNQVILGINAVSIAIGVYGASRIFSLELSDDLKGAGHYQFLTNLSLIYSLGVFGLGFFAHLTRSESLYDLKNLLHPIGLALETIVAMVYWPLRLFCLHLLTPDPENFKIPLKLDLSVHLMPVVSLLIDYLVFMPRWTIKSNTVLLLITALSTGYWCLLKYLVDTENGGRYPYAFMDMEDDGLRALVFVAVGLVAFLQFHFMRSIYDFVVKKTENVDVEIDRKLD